MTLISFLCFPDTYTQESDISTENDILSNKDKNIITLIVEIPLQRHSGKAGCFVLGGGHFCPISYTLDTLVIFYNGMKS